MHGGRCLWVLSWRVICVSDVFVISVSLFSDTGRCTMGCFLAEQKDLRSSFRLGRECGFS